MKQTMKQMNHKAARTQLTDLSNSELLTNMNHVIRNRMDAIIEMTKLTLGTDLTKKQRGYLETVRSSADSLVSFLNDILDLSNIETRQLKLEEIDFEIRTTLEHAAQNLRVNAKAAGRNMNWNVDPDVPTTLIGDPGRLCQIIINLTQNAIKYTKKGKVIIRLIAEKKEAAAVLLHFAVSGIGNGISREQLTEIFKNFTQVQDFTFRDYNSQTLGLSLSKHLVDMMGGRIWLESEVGGGSTLHFTVRIGLSHGKSVDESHLKYLDLTGVPVLIVDDNEINRFVFQEMICSRGLIPAEAANGKEAIMKARKAFRSGNPYRVILLDLQMPGMDGFEVARNVKQSPFGEDVKIILLTSVGQKGDTAICKELGISGYLLKPVKHSELLDTISIALGNQGDRKVPVITRYTIQEARKRLKNPLTVAK
jgi:two-component system sensor histidine kinase/response regulator